MKTIAGVLFLILLFPLSSSALPIIQDEETGTISMQAFKFVGQSFLITNNTNVASVGAYVSAENTEIGDISFEMSLYLGDGDFRKESRLFSEEFFLSSQQSFQGYKDMDVSSVSFEEDTRYTLGFSDADPQWLADIFLFDIINFPDDDPYVGGNAFEDSMPRLDADLRFRVRPVPEPATILLLGAGLVGLAGLGRKKLRKK